MLVHMVHHITNVNNIHPMSWGLLKLLIKTFLMELLIPPTGPPPLNC